MGRNLEQIKKASDNDPRVTDNEVVIAMADNLDKVQEIRGLSENSAGKVLIKKLRKDVRHSINTIIGLYKTASHIELIAIIAQLEPSLRLLNELNGSVDKEKNAQAILDKEIQNIIG